MPAQDSIHQSVKNALLKDGWTITNEPFTLEYESDRFYADICDYREEDTGAERRVIVVEVKSFTGASYCRSTNGGDCAMDKRDIYAAIVRETISRSPYYVYGSKNKAIETEFICDDAKGQYILLDIGWRDGKRAFNPIVYVRIINDKIWMEEDRTEDGITEDLLRAGVPKEDIVLAFHSPEMRPYTEFAVA